MSVKAVSSCIMFLTTHHTTRYHNQERLNPGTWRENGLYFKPATIWWEISGHVMSLRVPWSTYWDQNFSRVPYYPHLRQAVILSYATSIWYTSAINLHDVFKQWNVLYGWGESKQNTCLAFLYQSPTLIHFTYGFRTRDKVKWAFSMVRCALLDDTAIWTWCPTWTALSIHKIDLAPTNSTTSQLQAVPLLTRRMPDKGRHWEDNQTLS
jgi:hypothetical protein